MAERVVIHIEVNSDIAEIEATRAALRRLTGDQKDLNDEMDRHNKTQKNVQKETKKTKRDHDALGNSLRDAGKGSKTLIDRYKGMSKELITIRKDISKAVGALGGMLGMINKLSLMEIPLLAAGLAGISALFKGGSFFANMYSAAMSTVAYGISAAVVALSTFLAAQKEFKSVQFAPMYAEGANNTADRFIAASQAMSMFTDDAQLAIVGTKGLDTAFRTLSKQAPITGGTVSAFRGLMNVVAGSGGDLEKGAGSLAEFLAKVQKTKSLAGASAEAKKLGPDFETIIKEAQAAGIKTSDEFFKAASEGNLGKTFNEKYAGQLDALNNTLMGRFKAMFSSLKAYLTDLGMGFLDPAKDALGQIEVILKRTFLSITPLVANFGAGGFMENIVEMIDKAAYKVTDLMYRFSNTSPGIFGFFKDIVSSIGRGFEKMQDWARQFKDAGQVIIDDFIEPVVGGLIEKFGGGMNLLSDLILSNRESFRSFADAIVNLIAAVAKYGDMLKVAFIGALPAITTAVNIFTKLVQTLTYVGNKLMALGKLGGGAGRAVASAAVLVTMLTLATRFFKVVSGRMGKDQTINAKAVYINTGAGGVHGAGMGGRGGAGGIGSISATQGSRSMGLYGRMNNAYNGAVKGGAGFFGARYAGAKAGMRQVGQNFGGGDTMYGLGNMGLMLGGAALGAASDRMGGTTTAGGAITGGAGQAMGTIGTARMLGASTSIQAGLGVAAASNAVGGYIGGKFSDDSVKSRGMATLAGAAGGAATGAAIGSVLAPFTFGLSTAAAASIGAIVGGVSAYVKSGAQRREARKAAQGLIDNYGTEVTDLLASGDVAGLQDKRAQLQGEIAKQAAGDTQHYYDTLEKLKPQLDAINRKIDIFTGNASLAEEAFGMSTDKLNQLASAAGLDASKSLLTFNEMLNLVADTAEEKTAILSQYYGKLGTQAINSTMQALQDTIDRPKKLQQAQSAANAAQSKVLGGATSDADLAGLLSGMLGFGVAQFGQAGGLANTRTTVMKEIGEGGALSGLDQTVKDRLVQMMNNTAGLGTGANGLLSAMGPDAAMKIAGTADVLGVDTNTLQQLLTEKATLDPNVVQKFMNMVIAGDTGGISTMLGVTGSDAGQRRMMGDRALAVSQISPNNTINNVTINARILDPAVIREIKEAIGVDQRSQSERGGSGPTVVVPKT